MDYLHWIFLALYMTLAVAAMVTILLDNRQPAKTMAWVLVLMFLPVVGIILYFFYINSLTIFIGCLFFCHKKFWKCCVLTINVFK